MVSIYHPKPATMALTATHGPGHQHMALRCHHCLKGLAFAEYSLDTRLYSSKLINHFKVID